VKPLDPQLLKVAAPARGYVVLTAVLGAATAGLVVAQALLIAAVIAPVISSGAHLAQVRSQALWLAAVVVARAVVSGVQERYAHRASIRVIVELRRKVIERAVELGPRWLSLPTATGSNSLDVVTLATRGLDDLRPYFVRYLPQLLLAVTVTPATLVVVLTQDWVSAAIIAGTIPLIPIFMILVGRLTQDTSAKRLATMSRLGAQVLDLIAGLPTLRAFGRELGPIKRVKALGEAYTTSTMRTLQVAFLSGLVLELLTTLSVALVAVGVGLRLVYGHLGLEISLAIIMLAPEVYLPIRNVGMHFHASTNGIAAFNSALAVLAHPLSARGTTTAPNLKSTVLSFEGVSVAAPGRDLLAPNALSAQVRPGELTVLTGPSGAGKSTAVLALLGLVDLSAGRIVLAPADQHTATSVDLAEIDPRSLWSQVSWLTQRGALGPGTLEEVLNADRATPAPAAELAEAIELAGLTDVIAQLPQGLATRIGTGGVGLSVGQRQRITLARAVLSPGQLVILDEPTAHLDAVTEAHVLGTICALRDQGRTVLVLAHRSSLVALADTVIEVSSSAAGCGALIGEAARA